MNRKSLFGRFVNPVKSSAAERPEYARMRLEPLEDRKMLVATIYVNDNWVNVTDPGNPVAINDVVVNSLDAVNPGGIIATYGVDAFGTVDGTSVAGKLLIYDAIQNVDAGGQINLLDGTYTESDIVIDKSLNFQGAVGATSLIRPEVVSSGATSDFGVGTRSGIIIYSPSVTISDVTVDGNANGSLGAGLNFHHGITTLYATQNGGDYASLRNGNLPVIQLGPIANAQRSIPALRIQNVTVNDVFWHGITMGAPAGKVYGESSTGLDIQNAVVNNVGNSADENRIGILTLNLDNSPLTPDANVLNSTVNGAGVGIALLVNGPPFDFADNDGARSKAGVALSTVNNAVFRAYDIRFNDGQQSNFGNEANWSGANNATGLYLNYGNPLIGQFRINGAKIGVHIQNSPLAGGGGPIVAFGGRYVGPGTGVAGSVGVLIDNDGTFSDSTFAMLTADLEASGYETGVKVVQNVAPGDSLDTIVTMDRVYVTGNGTDISVGNGAVLRGNPIALGSVSITGDGKVEPYYDNFGNDFRLNPGNAATPIFAPSKASAQQTGNLSFGSGATFAPFFTGESGGVTLFDFNNFANYPFATPPDEPVNGIVPAPYGALFNWFGNVTQDGSGQLVIGGAATNGYGYDFLFGSNNTPVGNDFQLQPTDISGHTNVDIAVRLGAGNQSPTVWIGLFDIRGNVQMYTVDASTLNSSTFTTVSVNMISPSIDLTGPDPGIDLTKIVGYVVGGDQGTFNALQNIPLAFDIDNIGTSSLSASRLDVTGTVNLGGATLGGSLRSGFLGGTTGTQYTIINNDGADAVVGTFAGLAQGATVNIGGQNFSISYIGGTGNDVVLTKLSAASVVGRRIFYNQSKFDGNTTGVNASDDLAIATDKSAYLPGSGASTFSNITSYTRGINGIMVDVVGTGALTVADFTFKMSLQTGANNTPSTWSAAPAPVSFSVRAGAGVSGSDRVEIIWANGAIANRWLEVIVEGNDTVGGFNTNTGLTASDRFYFGNRIGDNGTGTATLAITSATDELAARNNPGAGATITNLVDYDRSGIVSAVDSIAARNNSGTLTKINLTNPPAAPEGDGDAAVATALAIPGLPSIPGVPAWIARRLDSIDLNSGRVAQFLEHLADVGSPGTIKILEKIHDAAHELGLEHDLLDDLLEGLA